MLKVICTIRLLLKIKILQFQGFQSSDLGNPQNRQKRNATLGIEKCARGQKKRQVSNGLCLINLVSNRTKSSSERNFIKMPVRYGYWEIQGVSPNLYKIQFLKLFSNIYSLANLSEWHFILLEQSIKMKRTEMMKNPQLGGIRNSSWVWIFPICRTTLTTKSN